MNSKRLLPVLIVLCLASLLVQGLTHPHGHFPYEEWIGFVPAATFVSIFLLITVAHLMRRFLHRDVTYYQDDL